MKIFQNLISKKINILNVTLLLIAFAITTISILTGSYVREKENIQVGMVSPQRYVATRDMVDKNATEKLKEAARASVGPLYKHDTTIQQETIADVDEFFKSVDEVLKSATEVDGVTVYNKDAVLKIPVAFSEKQYKTYAELTQNGKSGFRATVIEVTNFAFDQGITEESLPKALVIINDALSQSPWNQELKNMAYMIISAAIKPNLVLDEEAVSAAREQKVSEVSDVMIMKDQKIVDDGEVITESIFNILEELNLINQSHEDTIIPIIGSLVIVCLLFLATFFYFITQYRKLMLNHNDMIILFAIFVLTIVILRATASFSTFVLIPVGIFAMLVSILINTRVALVLNMFVCIIGTFIYNGSLDFILYFSITGTLSALLIEYTKRRKHIVLVAAAIASINFFAMIAIGVFVQNGYSKELLIQGEYAFVVGIVTVIIVIGSLPLWEAVFEVDTPVKLLELTNPNNELMRRLMIEAPGTYHHCLIVANLAETAAYDIEADTTLARVGSYYHDIGKLKYPLYFGENQIGDNPHDDMDPYNSTSVIIQHIRHGKELAAEFKLPKVVRNILEEHHGTTFVKYFYYKAGKSYPEGTVLEKDFRYPGPIPQTREAAIVMLADTVEAAVRSTISDGKNIGQVDVLIRTLIKDKLDDGQLADSQLKIKDLDTIRKAFLKVFQGMYHDRISYPKDEEIASIKQKVDIKEVANDSTN